MFCKVESDGTAGDIINYIIKLLDKSLISFTIELNSIYFICKKTDLSGGNKRL
jgi:hypothetical protein